MRDELEELKKIYFQKLDEISLKIKEIENKIESLHIYFHMDMGIDGYLVWGFPDSNKKTRRLCYAQDETKTLTTLMESKADIRLKCSPFLDKFLKEFTEEFKRKIS